jgi:hypothetical protein
MQDYTSAATSLNQVPTLIKRIQKDNQLKEHTVLLDFGAGRFTKTREYVESTSGTIYYPYDPYNLSNEVNDAALARKYDVIMLSNVLNVIKQPADRKTILQLCRLLLKPGGRLYIRTYQAPPSKLYNKEPEPGQPTKGGTCWQNCQPLSYYYEEIKGDFKNIQSKAGYLIASN